MKQIIITLIASSSLFFIGCFDFAKETPKKRIFSLRLNKNEHVLKHNSKKGVLKVRRFSITPEFSGRSFVYHKGGGEYESDYYNEFIVSPSVNITGVIEKWLEESNVFTRVVPPASQLHADYILEGSIYSLYGDYENSPYKAVIEIKFLLLNDDFEPVFEKKYKIMQEMPNKNAHALIQSYHKALGKILKEFQNELSQSLIIENVKK